MNMENKCKYNLLSTTSGETIEANWENAHDKQFLLLPQHFQKSSIAEVSESLWIWERA